MKKYQKYEAHFKDRVSVDNSTTFEIENVSNYDLNKIAECYIKYYEKRLLSFDTLRQFILDNPKYNELLTRKLKKYLKI